MEKTKKNNATPVDPPVTSKFDRAIEALRPDRKSGIRYNIDQTRAVLDGGETKVMYHQTKALYKYPLPDEVPIQEDSFQEENIRFCSPGIGPLKEYLEDKWEREEEEYQIKALAALKRRLQKTAVDRKEKKSGMHTQLLEAAGPDWFQELSPAQMKAAESLKDAMLADLKTNSTIQTRTVIGHLGLVLRPNCKHVLFALKHCCNCPVEFLLLLYHLINPYRTEYSVNDRILLSSVAHLTLPTTLMEMHIRLPSPPPTQKVTKKCKRGKLEDALDSNNSKGNSNHNRKRKKKKCNKEKSPYLEPFTFKPAPPKHQGKYEKKLNLEPQSPYFQYIKQFKLDIAASTGRDDSYSSILDKVNSIEVHLKDMSAIIPSEAVLADTLHDAFKSTEQVKENLQQDEYALVADRNLAQEEYSRLWENADKAAPKLQFCHVYYPCHLISDKIRDNIFRETWKGVKNIMLPKKNDKRIVSSIPSVIKQALAEYEQKKDEDEYEQLYNEDPNHVHVPVAKRSSRQDLHMEKSQIAEENIVKPVENLEYGINVNIDITTGYEQVLDEKTGQYVTTSTRNTCEYTITFDENVPDMTVGQHVPENSDKNECKAKVSSGMVCEHAMETVNHECDSEQVPETCCPCCGSLLVLQPQCVCKDDFSSSSSDTRSVPEIDDGYTLMSDDLKKKMKEELQVRKVSHRENRNPTYVISGVTICDGKQTYIISDSYERQCDCMYNYEQAMKRYQGQVRRQELEQQMEQAENKLIISGVTRTASGNPVYILGGVAPPHRCQFVDEREKLIREHEEMTARIKSEQDGEGSWKIKYLVSDIKTNEDGNQVYLISGARPLDECACMQLYNRFNNRHRPCLESYKAYMQYIAVSTKQYLAEMDPVYKAHQRAHMEKMCSWGAEEEPNDESTPLNLLALQQPSNTQDECTWKDNVVSDGEGFNTAATAVDCLDDTENWEDITVTVTLQDKRSCKCCGYVCEESDKSVEQLTKDDNDDDLVLKEEADLAEAPSHAVDTDETVGGKDGKENEEGVEVETDKHGKKDSSVRDSSQKIRSKHAVKRKSVTLSEKNEEFKRYFILKHIPKEKTEQLKLLQKVLQSLADDGFPLAKLPESYKLPIFDLWMDLRCGRRFTVQDLENMYDISKSYWNHTNICQNIVPTPELPISVAECHTMNAAQLPMFKRKTSLVKNGFYRDMRKMLINDSREFYPTLFYYQFPFPIYHESIPSYRDTYFAYMPSKEEDVMAFKPWYKFESTRK